MVKFSEDLWDGFDACSVKTEQGLQVVRDITEFLKKRANLEAEYAKNLAALCKTVPGAGMFAKHALIEKETKTLQAALLSVQQEGAKQATHHQDFSNKIVNDVIKPLENFVKTKDPERKKSVTEGQKRIKALNDAKSAADKAKDAYTRAMKEAEAATEAHEKAQKDLQAQPDKKNLQDAEKRAAQKVPALTDKAKASESAYQKAVEAANEMITKTYGEHIPPVQDQLQSLEEERYAALRSGLEEYLKGQRALPQQIEERCSEIDKTLSSLDTDADLNEFAEAHKSTLSSPELVKFVPYKDKGTGEMKEPEKKEEKKEEKAAPATTTTATATTTDEDKHRQEEDLFK